MVPYDPAWSFEFVLPCMVLYCPLQSGMVPYGALWSHRSIWFVISDGVQYGPLFSFWLCPIYSNAGFDNHFAQVLCLFLLRKTVRGFTITFLQACFLDDYLSYKKISEEGAHWVLEQRYFHTLTEIDKFRAKRIQIYLMSCSKSSQ